MNTRVFRKIGYGMYIISSKHGDKLNGQIVNTFFQVSSNPPDVAISISKENLTHEFIMANRKFTASILSQDAPMTFIGRFGFRSGRDINKFEGINYKIGISGVPIVLDYTVGYLEVEVNQEMDCGSHTVFIGRVIESDTTGDAEPMTYAYYHTVKGGKSPKNAPTFIKEEPREKPSEKMASYVCGVCGYVYNPDTGDPDSGVQPGTSFDDLPADWVCPVCGAERSEFQITNPE
jgi:flavin reductase (DIM6/NTAB) family NADH-FMN oxidoreductase RutF/rubredoxin